MLKRKIISYSKKIGIDLIGFTNLEMSKELEKKLILQQELGYKTTFQKGSIEERMNPKLLMDDCQTIIAIALAYPKTCQRLENLSSQEVYFSSSSWGQDYHKVLKEKLELLAAYIKTTVPELKYLIAIDNSPLCDRTIAYQAGLGFFGKNNLLINEQYGSYIFLGCMLANLNLEVDKPVEQQCTNCNKCIKACPTGALNDSGILNSNRCLAYLTQKKELTEQETLLLNNCIYGCDICAQVCPHNKTNNIQHREFNPSNIEFIDIKAYIPLSNKQFKLKFGTLSGSWRGAKIINRNVEIYRQKINK